MQLDQQFTEFIGALPGHVRLPHRLDGSSVPAVRVVLDATVDRCLRGGAEAAGAGVVLEMADVEWMDLTGLGLLVGVNERLRREGHQLVLLDPPRRLRRVLAVSGLGRVLHATTAQCAGSLPG